MRTTKKEKVIRQSFTTRIETDLITELKHAAIDQKKSVNHLIEQAIKDFLKKLPAKK